MALSMLFATNAVAAAAAETPGYHEMPNTDWSDSLTAHFPFREPPAAANLSSCVDICRAWPECVAVAWNPAMNQAQCQLKCAARAAQRFISPNCTGVIVKPNATSCPLPTWHPPAWDADIVAGTLLLAGPSEPGGHVGNGYVAAYILALPGSSGPTVSGVEHISGVYAGKRLYNPPHTWPNKDCDTWCDRAHRVDLASFTSTATVSSIDGSKGVGTASAQDLAKSAFYVASRAGSTTCLQRTYAHRGQMHLLNTDFTCTNAGTAVSHISLSEPGPSTMPLRDGSLAKAAPMGEVKAEGVDSQMVGVDCSRVEVRVAEKQNGTRAVVGECHTHCDGRTFTVAAGSTRVVSCISARHSSVDFDASNSKGPRDVVLAKQSWKRANETSATLWSSHVAAQQELFVPGIEVEGNPELAAVINVTVEALLAAYRADAFPGAGSGGLAADAYAGATDWDEEIWFFPAFNWFYPKLARQLVDYRYDRAEQARLNAANPTKFPFAGSAYTGNRTFKGIAYPWFSALTGIEQQPGNGEDHLQGDIALAFVQHWQATGDLVWLKQKGYPVIEGLAQFWVSRVDHDADGTWHIRRSMSPDEFSGNSSDPVYTTAIAQITLRAAHKLAAVVGKQPDPAFLKVAAGLHILYDKVLDYHPEHNGYLPNQTIKQADVVMLGYPLAYEMPIRTQRNDLAIYANVTDPDGPGMTWGIHAIIYRNIGEEAEAARNFVKGYESYVRGRFKTWHEGYGVFGGVTTFITGASGWLQSVFAGYGGIRMAMNGTMLIRNPMPPPNCTAMKMRQINYLGNFLTIDITRDGWSVALVDGTANTNALPGLPVADLELMMSSGKVIELNGQKPIACKRGDSAQIRRRLKTDDHDGC